MARSRTPFHTPEHKAMREKIIEYIRNGNHVGIACEAAGLSAPLFYKYMQVGEGKPGGDWKPPPEWIPELEDFARRVRIAEAEAETQIVDTIKSRALTDAEIGLKFLRVRYPYRWGEKSLNINISWQAETVQALDRREVSWEALEAEFGKEILEREIVPLLPAPLRAEILSDDAKEAVVDSTAEEPLEEHQPDAKRNTKRRLPRKTRQSQGQVED